jgi:phosphoglycolate phosphatase
MEARDLWYSRGVSTRDDVIRGWGFEPDTFWEIFNQFDTPDGRIENTYLHDDVEALYEIPLQKAIVTHTPSDITLKILEMFGISGMFSAVVSCDECSGWKPSPLPVIYALTELELSPVKAIFVGDTESDVDSARDAGVTSVILDRNGWHADTKADFKIASLHELPELLGI